MVTNKPPLSRERIVRAALELADEVGASALSIRPLAARLGTRPMSLYRHVRDKDEIVAGVVALMLDQVQRSVPASAGDWRQDLRGWALAFRAVALDHAGAFPLFAQRASVSWLSGGDAAEAGVQSLISGGFTPDRAVRSLRAVVRYVIGFSLSAATLDTSAEDLLRAAQLRQEGHPHLADLVEDAVGDPEELFVFGLDALLDGLGPRRGV